MAREQSRMKNVLSCRDLPIRYLDIPKCGCTFIKNLFWRLDHGESYANPPRIHERTRDFARLDQFGLTVDEVCTEPYCFVVLRNPLDRFLSLYFDKVIGDGYRKFVPLRSTLRDNHSLNVDAKTPQDHTRNCHILIDWIEANLSTGNEMGRDVHWTSQYARIRTIRSFDMKVLSLNGLDDSLTMLLSPILPDIKNTLGNLERYTTNSKEMKSQILNAALKDRIHQIYRRDRENFDKLHDVWQTLMPKTCAEIPRASQIFE